MLKTSEERGDTLHVKFLVILNPGTSLLALEVHIGSRKRNLKGMPSDSLRGNRFQLGFERQWCFCGTKMRYVITKGGNKLNGSSNKMETIIGVQKNELKLVT